MFIHIYFEIKYIDDIKHYLYKNIYMVTPPPETYLFAVVVTMEGCETLMLSVSIVRSY